MIEEHGPIQSRMPEAPFIDPVCSEDRAVLLNRSRIACAPLRLPG
jgi:hypothetical protein